MSDEQPRTFSLGAVLTVITGIVLAPVEEIHELLDYMTSDTLMTHQLGRALTECQPELRRQHADLAAVPVPEFDGERHVKLWVSTLAATFGATLAVRPLPAGHHARLDPLAELVQMMDDSDATAEEGRP